MATPIRKCRFCGDRGKWTIYVILDMTNPKVGTGKTKWWQCNKCDTKETEQKTRIRHY